MASASSAFALEQLHASVHQDFNSALHGHLVPSSQCQVLSGVSGVMVQGALFAVSVSALLLKWKFEEPRRLIGVFLLDSSKQFVGAGVIHALNMICAVTFAHLEASVADECAWYWVNIMIDTTFGVLVCWGLLKLTERFFGYDSGHYGKGASTGINWEANPDYQKWLHQIMVWCGIVAIMKTVVVILMYTFAPFWINVSVACTHWIIDRNRRLLFVMLVTPTFMNMFQFLATDSFLKYSRRKAKEDVLPMACNEGTALRASMTETAAVDLRTRNTGTTG
jgi:hypothetical protein